MKILNSKKKSLEFILNGPVDDKSYISPGNSLVPNRQNVINGNIDDQGLWRHVT